MFTLTKRKCLLLLTFLLVVGAVVYFVMPKPQPVYQGKQLEAWLNDLVAKQDDPKAIAAVRAIGTNAIPYLLKSIAAPYDERTSRFYYGLDSLLRQKWNLAKKQIFYPDDIRFHRAVRGFRALGSSASNAAPQLGLLLDNRMRGAGVVEALVCIGPNSLPVLVEALTNRSHVVRYNALLGLHDFGPQAKPALKLVEGFLNDTNQVFGLPNSVFAARALKSMQPADVPTTGKP